MPEQASLAPRSASPEYVLDALKQAVELTANDRFYDLGCGGDARILIAMAQAAAEAGHQQHIQVAVPRSNAAGLQSCCSASDEQALRTAAATTVTAKLPTQLLPAVTELAPAAALKHAQPSVGLPQFFGIELNTEAAEKASAAVAALPEHVAAHITIRQGNLLELPLHDATVVYVYLLPRGLQLLASKLKEEARPGCIVLSYMFKVPGWEDALQRCLPVTSGRPFRPDVSAVSKLWVYRM